MIRFLRAFAWLRWRLLLNSVRGSARRDTWEQLSRLFALIVPAIIVVMSLGSIIAVSVGGLLGGNDLARGRFVSPDVIIFVVRAVLFGATALVVVMPIGGAAQTTGTKYSRLMLLPIPTRGLHLVEVLSSLADPWILFILPGLALFAVGLMWGGRIDLALMAAVAGAALAVVLASLAAMVSFSVSWLFRDRRRAELLTIIFVMSISVVALLPQFVSDASGMRRPNRGSNRRGVMTVSKVEEFLPSWLQVLPSELFGGAMTAAVVEGNRGRAATWIGLLFAEGIVFFWLSGLVHRRLLESAVGASGGKHRDTPMRPPWRLPGISPAAAAVAWVMFKSSMRSVRGRVAVLLPGPMMAIVSLVLLRRAGELSWITALGTHSHLMFAASLIIALFAIHPFTLNQFSSDRTGLTLQLLLPVSAKDLVRGKAIGGGALFLMAALISGVASALATGGGPPAAWVMTAIGGLATYIAVAPIATLLSALFPVVADMSKTGSGGNPHVASALIGMVVVGLAVLPALIIGVPNLLPGATPFTALLAMTA
ncbi:MAG: hypothetical protein ABIP90_08305, partial [Vicinamibacterales bacterium]